MKNSMIAKSALCAALAIVLGYIESLIPMPFPVPGIKLGLSNIAILFAVYSLPRKMTFFIMLVKVVVSALLFNGFQAFLYSISGGVLSVTVMLILKRTNMFSVIGVSIAGGIMHNIGQLISAAFVLKTMTVFYYFPVLAVSGMVTGFLLGVAGKLILNKIH